MALHLCLKEVKRESLLRHAEGADLRSALREAQSKGVVPEALASLHTELAHLRSTLFIFFMPAALPGLTLLNNLTALAAGTV